MAIPTIQDRIRWPRLVAVAIAVLAAVSLLLPFAPVYDPWGWLVWGREVSELELDTAAGPSWKPLPVIVTTALAPAGEAAPGLWLLLARAGWLAAAVLAWRLAARLAVGEGGVSPRAGIGAGVLAALGFVFAHDSLVPPVRQFAGGLTEPLLVALVLGAVGRALGGSHRMAVALCAGAALLRPEAWPFCIAYGVWLWRREPALRAWLGLGAIALPVLWLVPDLAGSGSPLTGADRARSGGVAVIPGLEAAGRGLLLAPLGLTIGAAIAVADALRRGRVVLPWLAAGAVAWITLVAGMAAVGYAGLARFSAPAGAMICVLGGVGVAILAARAASARPFARPRLAATSGRVQPLAAILAALAALALVADAGWRGSQIPADIADASGFATEIDQLFALVDETQTEWSEGCGPVTTTDLFTHTALAWRLDRRISDVGLRTRSIPRRGIVLSGPETSDRLGRLLADRGRPLARRGPWTAYALGCASSSASATNPTSALGVRDA